MLGKYHVCYMDVELWIILVKPINESHIEE